MQKLATGIEGLEELSKAFVKIGDDAMKYLKLAADEGAGVVLGKAKSKVSKKTGKLESRLTLTKSKVKVGTYSLYSKVSIPSKVAYGVPLELGHKLIISGTTVGTVKAKPFLRPAADESKDKVVDLIVTAMNKALDEIGGRR